jgi:hypothetical protein
MKAKVLKFIHDPKILRKIHGALTLIWMLMLIPSLIWWAESIPWLVTMSVWANIAGHWSAYQGASSEIDDD